jgi:hypothetical protein
MKASHATTSSAAKAAEEPTVHPVQRRAPPMSSWRP